MINPPATGTNSWGKPDDGGGNKDSEDGGNTDGDDKDQKVRGDGVELVDELTVDHSVQRLFKGTPRTLNSPPEMGR